MVAHAMLRDIAIDQYAGLATSELNSGLGQEVENLDVGKCFVPCPNSNVAQAIVWFTADRRERRGLRQRW